MSNPTTSVDVVPATGTAINPWSFVVTDQDIVVLTPLAVSWLDAN